MQADILIPSIWQPWAAWQHLPGHHTPPREQSLAAPQHVPAAFCYKVMTAQVLEPLCTLGHSLRSRCETPSIKCQTAEHSTAHWTASWLGSLPAGYRQLKSPPGSMLGKLLLAAAPVLLKGFDQVHTRTLLAEAAGVRLFQELFGLGVLGADALALMPAALAQVCAAVVRLAASCGLPPLAPCRPTSLQER